MNEESLRGRAFPVDNLRCTVVLLLLSVDNFRCTVFLLLFLGFRLVILLGDGPGRLQSIVSKPSKGPDIERNGDDREALLDQHRDHLRRLGGTTSTVRIGTCRRFRFPRVRHLPKQRLVVLLGRAHQLHHGREEGRVRLPAELQLEPGIGAKVPRAEHQRRDLRARGDLLDILDALDALDLRDDADMIVGVLHVEVVLGVERLVGDAGGEGPGAERAPADRGCCIVLVEAFFSSAQPGVALRTVVDLLDHVLDVLGALHVGEDDARRASV